MRACVGGVWSQPTSYVSSISTPACMTAMGDFEHVIEFILIATA